MKRREAFLIPDPCFLIPIMINRRNMLKTLALGAVAGSFGSVFGAEEKQIANSLKHPVRLGGPVFFSDEDPVAWAQKARETGYRAVYAPKVNLDDKDRIKAVVATVRENDLVIAEVGRWVNLLDADPEKRVANLKTVTEGLALADELDARCCVDIAGSFNTEYWFGPHPKNMTEEFFDLTVENARKIIDAVKPKRAKFAFEMMQWALPDSPDSYLKLFKAIDRKEFGVHVDVCNMVFTREAFWNNTALINETFDKLGPWIVSAHAKDLRWNVEMNIHFQECVIGQGEIDYGTYLKRLATLPNDVPLMMEHLKSAEEYEKSKQYIFETGRANGVVFEYL